MLIIGERFFSSTKDCRYDGRFFTSAEWDEGDGHHFDGHIEVKDRIKTT